MNFLFIFPSNNWIEIFYFFLQSVSCLIFFLYLHKLLDEYVIYSKILLYYYTN